MINWKRVKLLKLRRFSSSLLSIYGRSRRWWRGWKPARRYCLRFWRSSFQTHLTGYALASFYPRQTDLLSCLPLKCLFLLAGVRLVCCRWAGWSRLANHRRTRGSRRHQQPRKSWTRQLGSRLTCETALVRVDHSHHLCRRFQEADLSWLCYPSGVARHKRFSYPSTSPEMLARNPAWRNPL